MTRATLHDELMHEAGFETDYHRDLERRPEERRDRVRPAGHRIWNDWYRRIRLLGRRIRSRWEAGD